VGARLGVELARLGAAVHADARRLFRPHLEDLHARVEETIDLTKLVGGEAIMIEQIASPRALRVVSQVGQALPLHCTASGKAHLTQMSLAEAERELPRVLKQFTPATSADRESLLSLAGTANERRCQLDVEECFEGVCALGLPIRGIAADNYAIAVSMPSQRFGERLDFLSRELIKCQDAIERAIGAS
jgi:DNA-binding IclR family transcriptional regulator